jgi:DNA (cytosine-5)-methyltransferase 1
MKEIKIIELFAGVGGFRLGLTNAGGGKVKYKVVWSNQWEPGSKTQHASDIYIKRFGKQNHSNEDIQEVIKNKFHEISNHDLLVGGFPCQDYSVAKTLNQAKGINGKKGVLWWSIHSILKKKGKDAPRFLMLENVDRLLKSPSGQRGRDFAIMLASLSDLGYDVEWRVINAAEYGFPQRRRRVYILGYKKSSNITDGLKTEDDIKNWIYKVGLIAKEFPIKNDVTKLSNFEISGDLAKISNDFSSDNPEKSPFKDAGIMLNRKVYTTNPTPVHNGPRIVLKDIVIHDERKIPKEFYINEKDEEKWKKLKGAKKEERKAKNGFKYFYSEGPMIFPDPLDRPSRTIVTGEGGSGPSRFKHVIKTKSGKLRRLTPVELEKLNMFPADHTRVMFGDKITPDTKRAFIMGNALVVGVIEKLGKSLSSFIQD